MIARLDSNNTAPVWPEDYPASDDYTVANQGQLKHIAVQAAAEMNTRLVGGAGEAVNGLMLSWNEPNAGSDDYAVVNQGQLKTVAKLFYDRLIAVAYSQAYPWTITTTDDESYATANVGQVKYLFSFDFDTFEPPDAAGDVTAMEYDDGSVILYWTDNSNNESGFVIQRSDDGGLTWIDVYTTASNAVSHTVAPASAGTSGTSQFRVISTNGAGNSTESSSGISPELEPSGDKDQDGLNNAVEVEIGTDPRNPDSDNDTIVDGKDWAPLEENITQIKTSVSSYAVIEIGSGIPFSINESCEVVGGREPYTSGRSFYWSPQAAQLGQQLLGEEEYALGINDLGEICGTLLNSNDYRIPGYWSGYGAGFTIYGAPPGHDSWEETFTFEPWPSRIANNQSSISTTDFEWIGRFRIGPMEDFWTPNGEFGALLFPQAISPTGDIICTEDALFAGESAFEAWFVASASTSPEVLPDSSYFVGTGINQSGVISGYYGSWHGSQPSAPPGLDPAAIYYKDENEDYQKYAVEMGGKINAKWQVLESFWNLGFGTRLMTSAWEISPLESLVAEDSGYEDIRGYDINDSGVIAGSAKKTSNGQTYGVLLVPFEIVRETEPGSGQYKPIDQVPLFQGDPRQFGDSVTSTTLSVNVTPKIEIASFSLSSTAIDQLYVDMEGKGSGSYRGILEETGNQTNVFTDSQSSITLTVNQITSTRCDLVISGLGYQTAGFTLKKNHAGNYVSFVQVLEILLPSLSSSTVEHLTGKILLGQRSENQLTQSEPLVLDAVETGVDTNEFIDPQHGLKFLILSHVNDRLTLEVSSTVAADQEFPIELYETGSSTSVFTSQIHSWQINPKREDAANDPEALGSGVCFVRTAQIEGVDKLKMKLFSTGSPESEAPEQELALQPLAGSPGTVISEPFVLIPHESQVSYNQYQGKTVRSLRALAEKLSDKILWEYIIDDKPPLKTGIQTQTQRGMYAAWSVWELLRGNPAVEANLSSSDPVIKAEQEQVLAGLVDVKTHADTNLKLNGNVRIKNLHLASNTDMGDILRNYDYVLLAAHGMTRGPAGNYLTNPGQPRVPFGGFVMLDINDQTNFTYKGYYPDDIKNMTLARAPKLVFLSSCGSGETTTGSKAFEMREAFRSHVYLGWNDEVAMQQATLAEVQFFKVFKDEFSIEKAVESANEVEPTKSDKAWTATEPIEDQNIASLIRFEDKPNNGTYTAKELIETPHPGPYQSP